MELEQILMTTAGKIGLHFQRPQIIIDRILNELKFSPGTLYAWLHTDNGIRYLKEHYGETIKMSFESNASPDQADISEVPVVQ